MNGANCCISCVLFPSIGLDLPVDKNNVKLPQLYHFKLDTGVSTHFRERLTPETLFVLPLTHNVNSQYFWRAGDLPCCSYQSTRLTHCESPTHRSWETTIYYNRCTLWHCSPQTANKKLNNFTFKMCEGILNFGQIQVGTNIGSE